jgi:transcriptional repressor NrdR
MSIGIYKALEKRPTTQAAIENFIDKVEKELKAAAECEVTSALIGDLILRNLKELDEVAYVRFASVYKDFDNIDSFSNELESLKQK